MKNWLIIPLLLFTAIYSTRAQEMVIDSVDNGKFIGVQQGGEMGQFLYIPYFSTNKTDKNNFIIRQLNSQTFTEDQIIRLELPVSYVLKASAFNGSSYLLCFYDESRKEDVFISTTGSNINKKKTVKSTGSQYTLLSGNSPEDFVIVSVTDKGDYHVENTGLDLTAKWKKSFSAPSGVNRQVIHIRNNMGRLEVLRKDSKSNNKFEFSGHYLQLDSGEDMAQTSFSNEEHKLYPTFFSEKEGMNFAGGYYFRDGIYSEQPDGVFFSQLTPQGTIEHLVTVPYSQVIEDLKNTVGSKITKENTIVLFTSGYLSHETQNFIMAGQVLTKQQKENNSIIEAGDFVTVKFAMEKEYRGATYTPSENMNVTIKGDLSKTNMLDLGAWMANSSLLPFSHFVNMPGHPVVAYKKYEKGGISSLCFRTLGVKNDTTRPECMTLHREPTEPLQVTFRGYLSARPVLYRGIIPSAHDFGSIGTYELNKNLLLLTKTPLPRLDMLMKPIMPEDVSNGPHHTEPEDDQLKNEEGQSE
jgi:hypothetical protein